MLITKRGNDDEENDRVQFVFSKPERGVRRIIVEVDPPSNSTVIDVDFAGFPERIEGFERMVFDVVD